MRQGMVSSENNLQQNKINYQKMPAPKLKINLRVAVKPQISAFIQKKYADTYVRRCIFYLNGILFDFDYLL